MGAHCLSFSGYLWNLLSGQSHGDNRRFFFGLKRIADVCRLCAAIPNQTKSHEESDTKAAQTQVPVCRRCKLSLQCHHDYGISAAGERAYRMRCQGKGADSPAGSLSFHCSLSLWQSVISGN